MDNENVNEYEENFDDYIYQKLKEAEENEKNGTSYFTTENIFDKIREELNIHV